MTAARNDEGFYTRARNSITEKTQSLATLPATVGLQIFSIVPGIAGGLAGFLLAYRLSQARKVRTWPLVLASLGVALVTVGAIFIVRAEPEGPAAPPALPPAR